MSTTNDAGPGDGRFTVGGASSALKPVVGGMTTGIVAAFFTAVLSLTTAAAVRFKDPTSAKVTAPTLTDTFCEAPGASVTEVVDKEAVIAAGPARLKSNVSCTW